MDAPPPYYRAALVRRRRSGYGIGLVLVLVLIVSLGIAAWSGLLPVQNLLHNGPITITTSNAPTLIISNDASNSNSLIQRDAAPIHIIGSSIRGRVIIQATNIPLIGFPLLSYRQTSDHAVTFLHVDYHYSGIIAITVPRDVSIRLDSYGNGAEISGVTGRLVFTTYTGNIHVSNSIFSGPSLLQSYKGSLNLENVALKYPGSFESYQGDITFQGELAPLGDYFLSTYQGAIVLKLPASSSFTVDASTYQHTVITDFPRLPSGQPELHGSVGSSPRASIHLYTYQNTITLQQSKGA